MSAVPRSRDRAALDAIAGLMASASIFVSLVGVAYRPVRVIPFSIVIALVAAGMGGRHARLAAAALGVGGLSFVAGMVVAVITNNPIY